LRLEHNVTATGPQDTDCVSTTESETVVPNEIVVPNEYVPFNNSDQSTCENHGDIKLFAAHFLLYLSSSSSMTLSNLQYIQESVTALFHDSVSTLQCAIEKAFLHLNINLDNDEVQTLMSALNGLKSPFENIDTLYKLQKYIKNNQHYIEPVQITLGQRWQSSACRQQQQVSDSLSFVSIISTLKSVFRWKASWDALTVACTSPADHMICSFFDGTAFSDAMTNIATSERHETGNKMQTVFIQLYYDDFETANPIGSKTVIHKLGGFYYTIMNFPRKYNAVLSSIHLVSLTYTEDIKKYGMRSVLSVIKEELKVLEAGFKIELEDGSIRWMRVVLGNVVADNLGLHSLLGFVESFSHSFCCDLCLGTKEQFQSCFSEEQFKLRSDTEYEREVEVLAQSGAWSFEGVKTSCCLDELQFYHPNRNQTVDVMHDILQGVAPFEISNVLDIVQEILQHC